MKRQSGKFFLLSSLAMFGILLTLSASLFAEDHSDINSRAVHLTRRFQQQLGLSNDQAAQFQKILTAGMVNQVPPPDSHSPQDLQNYEIQKKQQWQQVEVQLFSVLTPEQQQRFQQVLQNQSSGQGAQQDHGQSDSQGQWPSGGRHHHRQGMNSGMWDQNDSDRQNNSPSQTQDAGPSYTPQTADPNAYLQTQRSVQELGAMYNPKTGKTFPSNFKYDPSTGDPLQPVR